MACRSVWRGRFCLTAVLGLVGSMALSVEAPPPTGPTVTVAQDGSGDENGRDQAAIQAAVEKVKAAGGGTVLLCPGTYRLHQAIDLSGARGVRLIGSGGEVILQAAPGVSAALAEDAAAGATEVLLTAAVAFPPGGAVEVHAPGETVTAPSGKTSTPSYFMVRPKGVSGTRLQLSRPLPRAVARGVTLLAVHNGIDVHGGTDITIGCLTIDMNRSAWPTAPLNHTYHCGVFAAGPYSYEKGPTGPAVERLVLLDCAIRNAHHRGVAFYSVTGSLVHNCRVTDTAAEGIDLDHFCYGCAVVGCQLERCRNIELNDASDCLISGNRLSDCPGGLTIWQWCRLPDLNVRNRILDNHFSGVSGFAIRIEAGADANVIAGNVISGGSGISVAGQGNLILRNDIAAGAAPGIRDSGQGNRCLGNALPRSGAPLAEP